MIPRQNTSTFIINYQRKRAIPSESLKSLLIVIRNDAVVCTQNTIFLGQTSSSSSIIIYSNAKNDLPTASIDTTIGINSFIYIGQYLNIISPANSLKLNKLEDRLLATTISGHFMVLDSSHNMVERIKLLFQDHEYKLDYILEEKRIGLIYLHTPEHLGETDFASFLPDGRSLIVAGREINNDIYLFSCRNNYEYTKQTLNLQFDDKDSFGQITDMATTEDYLALASSTSHLLVFNYVKNFVVYSQKLSDTFAEITSLDWRPKISKSSHLSLAAGMCDGFVKIAVFKSQNNADKSIEFDSILQYKFAELGSIRRVLYREYDLFAASSSNCLFDDKVNKDDFKLEEHENKWQFSGTNRTNDVANQTNHPFQLVVQRLKEGKTSIEHLYGHVHQEPILDFYVCGDLIISCSKNTVIASSGKLVFRINP